MKVDDQRQGLDEVDPTSVSLCRLNPNPVIVVVGRGGWGGYTSNLHRKCMTLFISDF